MANEPIRMFDFDSRFIRGMKSDADPSGLPRGYYFEGLNVLNVGGVISCRPGFNCVITLPDGNLQGASIFEPAVGLPQIVVVIDGVIYVADYPFLNFRMLDNVRLSSSAKQVFWANTEQSAKRLTDDFASAIQLITPRRLLIIQDGGFTAPVWYDGSDSGHIRNLSYETPAGGPMAWLGDRLWVAKGSYVYASDIANPLSFREQVYLGGVSAFTFPGEVTALAATPSLEYPQLLVFTEHNTSIVRADVRDRNAWLTTTDMQREIFSIGASSHRSIVSHFGQLSWFNQSGLMQFDSAWLSKQRARLPIRDNEMTTSKYNISDDVSLVAGAAFGPYILMSVPHEDQYNRHTWVLNDASIDNLLDDSGPSWASVWTGIRPVEWVYGNIVDSERCYCVSKDHDGKNRLWKIFQPKSLDNGCPITWAVFTRGHFGESSGLQKNPGQFSIYRYSDVAFTALEEDLDVGIYYAGGLNGAFKQVARKRVHALRGCLRAGVKIKGTSRLVRFKPQSRIVRTSDAGPVNSDYGSCPVERSTSEDRDESFQIAVVCQGPGTIRWIRSHGQLEPEDLSGDPEACTNETQEGAIRFDGAGTTGDTFEEIAASLPAAMPNYFFESNQTVTLDYRGLSSVAVAYSSSVISQEAADRVAKRIATRMAENEIEHNLTPVVSTGAE